MNVTYRCGCGFLKGAYHIGDRCEQCFTKVRYRNEYGNPVDVDSSNRPPEPRDDHTILDVPNLAEKEN